MTVKLKDIDDKLSGDAKAILGVWFGMGSCTTLQFGLEQSRPSGRAATALLELVARGYLSVEPFNDYGGLVFKPLKPVQQYMGWLRPRIKRYVFDLTEPVEGNSNGK